MAKKDIKRHSLAELEKMRAAGDFAPVRENARVRMPGNEFWARAKLVVPEGKKSVHLRLDADVLEWFRAQGRGHLTRMNAVLRSYMQAHRENRR
jgi:uncharacterized protein (DUF4415 family)